MTTREKLIYGPVLQKCFLQIDHMTGSYCTRRFQTLNIAMQLKQLHPVAQPCVDATVKITWIHTKCHDP